MDEAFAVFFFSRFGGLNNPNRTSRLWPRKQPCISNCCGAPIVQPSFPRCKVPNYTHHIGYWCRLASAGRADAVTSFAKLTKERVWVIDYNATIFRAKGHCIVCLWGHGMYGGTVCSSWFARRSLDTRHSNMSATKPYRTVRVSVSDRICKFR